MPQGTCAASVTRAARPYALGKTRPPSVAPEAAYLHLPHAASHRSLVYKEKGPRT